MNDGRYPSASKFAMAGFILTLLNIIFTLLVGVFATSLLTGVSYLSGCDYLYEYCYDPDGKTQYYLEGCVMSNIIKHQNVLFLFWKIYFKVVK